MISAFINCFKIPELRDRILFTLFLLFIARLGAAIPLPGIDPMPLQEYFKSQSGGSGGNILGLYNMFTGGALLKGSVFALGIMPYISASIIFQLMTAVVPSLARLQQEGEVGRQKLNQYTRYATLLICLVQGLLLLLSLENPDRIFPGYNVRELGSIVLTGHFYFIATSVFFLTAGTMLLMWLGEQITQRGIGNGISILITVGIVSDIPSAASVCFRMFFAPVGVEAKGLPEGILLICALFAVTAGIVAVTQAQRKIPVQYAKRVVGRKVYGGQSSFLPLKINYSGVMPIIFASSILLFLQTMFNWLGAATDLTFLRQFSANFNHGQPVYYCIYGVLIFAFSYFWVSVMFKPVQVADDLKKYGGYIPGVRPGEATARFLDFVMTRLTLAGAVFLLAIAVIPDLLLYSQGIPYNVAQFFGGTGMLIVVGVMLDTLRQVETFLLQRHYDGFLKKGRIKGRSVGQVRQLDTTAIRNARQFWIWLLVGLTVGLASWIINMVYFK